MAKSSYEFIGERFSRLVILEVDNKLLSKAICTCKCDCGNITLGSLTNLRNGFKH